MRMTRTTEDDDIVFKCLIQQLLNISPLGIHSGAPWAVVVGFVRVRPGRSIRVHVAPIHPLSHTGTEQMYPKRETMPKGARTGQQPEKSSQGTDDSNDHETYWAHNDLGVLIPERSGVHFSERPGCRSLSFGSIRGCHCCVRPSVF